MERLERQPICLDHDALARLVEGLTVAPMVATAAKTATWWSTGAVMRGPVYAPVDVGLTVEGELLGTQWDAPRLSPWRSVLPPRQPIPVHGTRWPGPLAVPAGRWEKTPVDPPLVAQPADHA